MADLVVSTEWLYQHLSDPQVAIADCRFSLASPELGQQQYQAGHIPGAYYFDLNQDLSAPVQRHGGRHPLPDVAMLSDKLRASGIHSSGPQGPTLIVAYDDSRQAFASRFWWLLRYLGHPAVAVLDGGFSAWVASGYPVTDDVPPSKAGTFSTELQEGWTIGIEGVRACKDRPGVVLVDSRESNRYRGEWEPIDPVAGHISGAVNYPWQEVTDEKGYVRSPAEQQDRWKTLNQADEIIVYCGSGVTACVNLLSLAMAGIEHVKLYPGSWSDWCSYLDQ